MKMFNFLNLFKKRESACTPQRAAEIWADCVAESLEEDRLFYEWCDGPGKDLLVSMDVWDDGWMPAFEKYKDEHWILSRNP